MPETVSFVAKVQKVKTRKSKPYFIYRFTAPKDAVKGMDLVDDDYLLFTARKADWYHMLDWSKMANTWSMVPKKLQDEIISLNLAPNLQQNARRSPMEMVVDIMNVVSQGPTKPTHILYKANMSWKVLSYYLEFLVSHDFLKKTEVDGRRSTYVLTEKGLKIKQLYEAVVGDVGKDLRELNEITSEIPRISSK